MRVPVLVLAVATGAAACQLTSVPPAAQPLTVAQQAVDALIAPAHATQLLDDPDRLPDVAEKAVAAVVHIAVEGAAMPSLPFAMPQRGQRMRGSGSGVLVDADGLIVTNHHVVAHAESLEVTLSDGRSFDAEVRASDPNTDVAIVALTGDVPGDLPTLSFGDSDRLRLGEVVLAIGSPFELQGTVTMGIVSARGRHVRLAEYEDFIQTDAAINPGNSGGALVDLQGQLVGINTAISSRSGGYDGIGFAIPSNLVQEIVQRLRTDGKVVRGYLGVGIGDLDDTTARALKLDATNGALIAQVSPGTAAERAGLQVYDVIKAVDGEAVADADALKHLIALKPVGQKVRLDVLRDGKSRRLSATLDERPERMGAVQGGSAGDEPGVDEKLGVAFAPLDGAVRQQLGVSADVQGVVVARVLPGSRAAAAGLRRGDVLLEIDREAVASPAEAEDALRGRDGAMLRILRDGYASIVVLD